jgi:hypothetical protein
VESSVRTATRRRRCKVLLMPKRILQVQFCYNAQFAVLSKCSRSPKSAAYTMRTLQSPPDFASQTSSEYLIAKSIQFLVVYVACRLSRPFYTFPAISLLKVKLSPALPAANPSSAFPFRPCIGNVFHIAISCFIPSLD